MFRFPLLSDIVPLTAALPGLLSGLLLVSLLGSCDRSLPLPDPLPGAAGRSAAVVTSTGDTVVLDCDDDFPLSAFPAAVLDAVAAAFPDHTIHEAKICSGSGGTWYWFELYPLDASGEDITVAFDASGAWYPVIDADDDDDDGSGSGGSGGGDDDGFVVTTGGDTVAISCSDDGALGILPASILAAVEADYPAWTVEESKTCDAAGGPYYVVEIRLVEDLKTAYDAAGNDLVYFRD
jgi:hypothetical protein